MIIFIILGVLASEVCPSVHEDPAEIKQRKSNEDDDEKLVKSPITQTFFTVLEVFMVVLLLVLIFLYIVRVCYYVVKESVHYVISFCSSSTKTA